jgi:Inhibitor of vertebrate lysozyme (Ivy)
MTIVKCLRRLKTLLPPLLAVGVPAIVLLSTGYVPAIAQNSPSPRDYILYIAKQNQKIISAWKWILPKSFSNQRWIVNLTEATSTPVDRILLAGKQFVLGEACWPHNCGGNHVIFLIAMDGSGAYGLLSSETLKVPEQYFGRPNGDLTKLLKAKMREHLNDGDAYASYYR